MHFLGLGWRGQIEKVRIKVGQLLGVLERVWAVLGSISFSHLIMGWSCHTCSIASWTMIHGVAGL